MPRAVPVSTFIEKLKLLESNPITTNSVLEVLHDFNVDDGSVRRFAAWSDEKYMRHLLYKDSLFEVILICWKPGQHTPVHTHNGQLGWATITRGGLDVVNYQWHGCDRPENQNVVGIDCLSGGKKVDIRATGTVSASAGGPVATVTKQQSIHQILCPAGAVENAASVHIYSLPIDSCVSFDLEHQRCGRRILRYDTIDGQPNTAPIPVQPVY
ncbi:MAG: cysteine dioxygenase [Planctomycetota bacterium]